MCPSTEGDIFVMTEGEKEGEKRECLQIAMQQTREKKQTLQCKQDNADQNQR